MTPRRKAYERALKAATKAAAKAFDLRVEMQRRCKHPHAAIVEGEYRPPTYFSAMPPFRVCKRCGYAEQGWHCGYTYLAPDDYSMVAIDRDEAFKFVVGVVHDNHVDVRFGRLKLVDMLCGKRYERPESE